VYKLIYLIVYIHTVIGGLLFRLQYWRTAACDGAPARAVSGQFQSARFVSNFSLFWLFLSNQVLPQYYMKHCCCLLTFHCKRS